MFQPKEAKVEYNTIIQKTRNIPKKKKKKKKKKDATVIKVTLS
jgi:hypothetical protein